jgi:TetR/AcrR family transcriptional repressor of mexJK operon
MSAVQHAIAENLTEVGDLEVSLIALARSITVSAIGSSDYTALIRLVSMESANLPELRDHLWSAPEPEEAVAERFADFGRRGLLEVPNPRLAADHFVALTLSPSTHSLGRAITPNDADTDQMIIDGVRAFLRAYRVRGGTSDRKPA